MSIDNHRKKVKKTEEVHCARRMHNKQNFLEHVIYAQLFSGLSGLY